MRLQLRLEHRRRPADDVRHQPWRAAVGRRVTDQQPQPRRGAARPVLVLAQRVDAGLQPRRPLCLRNLLTGSDAESKALQTGLDETCRNGKLGGKPLIFLHGRNEALLSVNHPSRPYTALSKLADGAASQLSYIEGG